MSTETYLMKIKHLPLFIIDKWFNGIADGKYTDYVNYDFAVDVPGFIPLENLKDCSSGWYGIKEANYFDNPNLCLLIGFYGGIFNQYIEIDPEEGLEEGVRKLTNVINDFVINCEGIHQDSLIYLVKKERGE